MSEPDAPNFAREIEKEAGGDVIEAIVIRELTERPVRRQVAPRTGALLSWDQARPMLDYEYDDWRYGCDSVWAWTKDRVIYVDEYDGMVSVVSLPRHPRVGKSGGEG